MIHSSGLYVVSYVGHSKHLFKTISQICEGVENNSIVYTCRDEKIDRWCKNRYLHISENRKELCLNLIKLFLNRLYFQGSQDIRLFFLSEDSLLALCTGKYLHIEPFKIKIKRIPNISIFLFFWFESSQWSMNGCRKEHKRQDYLGWARWKSIEYCLSCWRQWVWFIFP